MAADVDPWTPVDDPAQRVRKAIPGARITSERRTPQRNAAVGGAPNSAHLRGFATDFIPPQGSSPAGVEAALRKQGKFDQIIYEGDHVHYSDDPRSRGQVFGMQGGHAPDPWTPVQQDPWTPVASAASPAPKPAAPAQKPAQPSAFIGPQTGNPVSRFGHDVAGNTGRLASGAWNDAQRQQVIRDTGIDPITRKRASFLQGAAAPIKEGWDVVDTALSPFGGLGAAIGQRVDPTYGRPGSSGHELEKYEQLGEALAPIPDAGAAGAVAKAAKKGIGVLRDAQLAARETRAAEDAAQMATRSVPKPITRTRPQGRPAVGERPQAPVLAAREPMRQRQIVANGRPANPFAPEGSAANAGSVVGNETHPVERIDNALFRLGNHATGDKIEALQALRAAPPEVRDPKVQEELTHALEQRMIDPEAQLPEHLQAAEAVRQPWAERQRNAINSIRQRLADKGLTEEQMQDYLPDTGYVPRRVQGHSPGIDPMDPQRQSPLAWNASKKSLARVTGSMRARDQIVLQFEDGARRFEHRNPTNSEWKPGMTVRDPLTGRQAVVKQATIKEIEGAGARTAQGEPLTYHKNALVNTIDEALRAERVDRNLQVLDELTHNLADEGLAHRDEWHYKNEDGQFVRARSNTPRPEGFVELPHIPQLRGYSFDPRIAEVLKDYYPEKGEPIDNVIATVNRALNASLFITPFPHIKNVGTMWAASRGWDWLPAAGNYGRLMRTGRKAMSEVLSLGPRYRRFLREGSALQAGDEATRNFYQAMLDSAAKGIEQDPKIARSMNLSPVDLAKALYGVSHKVLWNVNDMMLLQRQMELEERGMATRDAIKESERWIANYRIPSQVFGSRAFQQFIADGKWINFGRYTYGKWRALGELAKQLAKGSSAERMDALGKVAVLGVMSLMVYPALDWMAQKATGNQKAKFTRGGQLAPIDALTDREKDWASKMASFMTPAPLIETGMEVYNNRDSFTGQHIVEPGSKPPAQALQMGEYGAGRFYPAQEAMEAMQPGGAQRAAGRLFGLNLPTPQSQAGKAKGKRYDRAAARRRERKDPLQHMLGLQ